MFFDQIQSFPESPTILGMFNHGKTPVRHPRTKQGQRIDEEVAKIHRYQALHDWKNAYEEHKVLAQRYIEAGRNGDGSERGVAQLHQFDLQPDDPNEKPPTDFRDPTRDGKASPFGLLDPNTRYQKSPASFLDLVRSTPVERSYPYETFAEQISRIKPSGIRVDKRAMADRPKWRPPTRLELNAERMQSLSFDPINLVETIKKGRFQVPLKGAYSDDDFYPEGKYLSVQDAAAEAGNALKLPKEHWNRLLDYGSKEFQYLKHYAKFGGQTEPDWNDILDASDVHGAQRFALSQTGQDITNASWAELLGHAWNIAMSPTSVLRMLAGDERGMYGREDISDFEKILYPVADTIVQYALAGGADRIAKTLRGLEETAVSTGSGNVLKQMTASGANSSTGKFLTRDLLQNGATGVKALTQKLATNMAANLAQSMPGIVGDAKRIARQKNISIKDALGEALGGFYKQYDISALLDPDVDLQTKTGMVLTHAGHVYNHAGDIKQTGQRMAIDRSLPQLYGTNLDATTTEGLASALKRVKVTDAPDAMSLQNLRGLSDQRIDAKWYANDANAADKYRIAAILKSAASQPNDSHTEQAVKHLAEMLGHDVGEHRNAADSVRDELDRRAKALGKGAKQKPTPSDSGAAALSITDRIPFAMRDFARNLIAEYLRRSTGKVVDARVQPGRRASSSKPLTVDADAIQQDPTYAKAIVDRLASHPGLADSPKNINGYSDALKQNLVELYRSLPDKLKIAARDTYYGANKIAALLAKEYNLPVESVAASIAALSPRMEWSQNVSLAKRMLSLISDESKHSWDPRMEQAAKAQSKSIRDPNGIAALQSIRGRDFGDLTTPEEQAMWVRIYDKAHHPRGYQVLHPSGDSVGYAQNQNGSRTKIGWGGYGDATKALRALVSGGDMSVISDALGKGHKVRSIYNNIVSPWHRDNFVTVDTHQVAASHLSPYSARAQAVKEAFGGNEMGSSAKTGIRGTYPVYVDAAELAAWELGYKHANQLQGVIWEGTRNTFPRSFRRPANLTDADKIWQLVDKGLITREQAVKDILEMAGPIKTPVWMTRSRQPIRRGHPF